MSQSESGKRSESKRKSDRQRRDVSLFVVEILPIRDCLGGKLADAQIHFTGGPLAGTRLSGFAVWKGENGDQVQVRFPENPQEQEGISLSRLLSDELFQEAVRSLISAAYFTHVKTIM